MTTVSDAFKHVISVGADTSPFIYLVEKHAVYIDRVRAIFKLVDQGLVSVTTSSLTLTEVLTVPFKLGNIVYEREYRAMLLNTINITTEPVSIAIAEQAAHLRVKYALKTPDAIHIATAIVEQCDAFLTNDKRLKQVTEINILVLDELELDPI